MTLQDELQINIVMSNYNQRSGSYSGNYDYIYLDNLASSSYSNLFRIDLKNLKIKTLDKTECHALYIPAYGSQPAAILVRIPTGKISQTTKLLLDVYDRSTTFSSTLTTGNDVLMFDANSDTCSQYFMNYSGEQDLFQALTVALQHHYSQQLLQVSLYQTIVLLLQDLKEFQDVLMLMIMQHIMVQQREVS